MYATRSFLYERSNFTLTALLIILYETQNVAASECRNDASNQHITSVQTLRQNDVIMNDVIMTKNTKSSG